MKTHLVNSAQIGTTGDWDVWSACGLGRGNRELVEFESAKEGELITCKACAKINRKRSAKT